MQSLFRRLVEGTIGDCPACGRRIQLEYSPTVDGREMFHASCHGSHIVHFLSHAATRGPEYRVIDELATWVRGLFVEDAFPDMMELLAYNAGKLPERRA